MKMRLMAFFHPRATQFRDETNRKTTAKARLAHTLASDGLASVPSPRNTGCRKRQSLVQAREPGTSPWHAKSRPKQGNSWSAKMPTATTIRKTRVRQITASLKTANLYNHPSTDACALIDSGSSDAYVDANESEVAGSPRRGHCLLAVRLDRERRPHFPKSIW